VVSAVDAEAGTLRQIASAIVARPGYVVVLVGNASPAAIVAARSEGQPADCGAVVRARCAHFGGRGGGRPDLAQAGGLTGDIGEMMSEARRLISG
jgi:alanyl-tRNA synthetase